MAEWKTGIFGCFDDLKLCVVTWLFPCLTTGKIAESLGTDTCFMGGCKIFIPCYNLFYLKGQRDAVREKQGIADEGCAGWLYICCLGGLSVMQTARELGVDPLGEKMGETIERV